jgi:hypothetical protein
MSTVRPFSFALVLALLPACNALLGIDPPEPNDGSPDRFGDEQQPTESAAGSDGGDVGADKPIASDASDSSVTGEDAGAADSHSDGNGGADVVGCDLSKPFGPPELLVFSDGDKDRADGRLSPDELTIYYNVARVLYQAKRPTRTSAFGDGTPLFDPSAALTNAITPTVTGDGLTLYFCLAIDNGTSLTVDIRMATRPSVDALFGTSSSVPGVNGVPSCQPYVHPSGDVLYFASFSSNWDPSRSRKGADGGLMTPELLANANSPQNELLLAVSDDEKTLFLGTLRGKSGLPEDYDIWKAKSGGPGQPFGIPTPVSEVNTMQSEFPDWVSPDGCRLYIHRADGALHRFMVAQHLP